MSSEIHKHTVIGVNDTSSGGTVSVVKISAAANTQVASLAEPAEANPPEKRLTKIPRKIEEAYHWSPTQQEVNTYIDSVEQELLQSCEDIPIRRGNKCIGTSPIKNQPSNSFILVWGLLAVGAGCFLELAKIILKALN